MSFVCLGFSCTLYPRRGFTESDFEKVAVFFDRAVHITERIAIQTGPKIKDFKAALQDGPDAFPELVELANEVKVFAQSFPTVGF